MLSKFLIIFSLNEIILLLSSRLQAYLHCTIILCEFNYQWQRYQHTNLATPKRFSFTLDCVVFDRDVCFDFYLLSIIHPDQFEKCHNQPIQCVYCDSSKIYRPLPKKIKQKTFHFYCFSRLETKTFNLSKSIRFHIHHHRCLCTLVNTSHCIQQWANICRTTPREKNQHDLKTLRNTIQTANEAMSTQIRSDRRITLIGTVVSFSPVHFVFGKFLHCVNVLEYTK